MKADKWEKLANVVPYAGKDTIREQEELLRDRAVSSNNAGFFNGTTLVMDGGRLDIL